MANGLVVEEVAIVPAAAFIAVTKIAKAIADSAVETYLRSPVTVMEEIPVVAPTPVARSPEIPDFRSHDPRARNPEVIIVTIRPVAGGPDVAVSRADGLLIDGEFRRGDSDGYSKADLG